MSTSVLTFPTAKTWRTAAPSILDQLIPRYDATCVERRLVDAPIVRVYDAVVDFDFLTVPQRHLATRALFSIRTAIEKVLWTLHLAARSTTHKRADMRLRDLPFTGEWVQLGARKPNEFAFGAVGRFWSGETKWECIASPQFGSFRRDGYARIGCHFLLEEQPDGRTMLTYEARTSATDPYSRTAFLRYWRVASPLVGLIMRATLTDIAAEAETAKI
jgi:hypothetical protein